MNPFPLLFAPQLGPDWRERHVESQLREPRLVLTLYQRLRELVKAPGSTRQGSCTSSMRRPEVSRSQSISRHADQLQ
jgi:hypothetical protein